VGYIQLGELYTVSKVGYIQLGGLYTVNKVSYIQLIRWVIYS